MPMITLLVTVSFCSHLIDVLVQEKIEYEGLEPLEHRRGFITRRRRQRQRERNSSFEDSNTAEVSITEQVEAIVEVPEPVEEPSEPVKPKRSSRLAVSNLTI